MAGAAKSTTQADMTMTEVIVKNWHMHIALQSRSFGSEAE
jgi:hypothetical protein